jgi:hypothetical protein
MTRFEVWNEQHNSQKQESIVVMVWIYPLRLYKAAGLIEFILSLYFVHLICPSWISEWVFVLMRIQCRIGAQPRCLVGRRPLPLLLRLGSTEFQIARNWSLSAPISLHLTNSLRRSLIRSAFVRNRPMYYIGYPRRRGLPLQQAKTISRLG